jgi:hypothetical protein
VQTKQTTVESLLQEEDPVLLVVGVRIKEKEVLVQEEGYWKFRVYSKENERIKSYYS